MVICCGLFLVTNILIVSCFGPKGLLNTLNVKGDCDTDRMLAKTTAMLTATAALSLLLCVPISKGYFCECFNL